MIPSLQSRCGRHSSAKFSGLVRDATTRCPKRAYPKVAGTYYILAYILADEGCGSEHDNSCNERCHAGIRQDFIENSGHCFPRVTSPIRAKRSLQHRGEKVKFLRIRPLNTRKK